MIPVTYPSLVSTSKESQMVVFALTNVTGLKRWTDYIPVKLQSTGADIANSFNTNGYLACDFLQTTFGKQAWIDYIPVFVDNAADTVWQVSDTGFIPFNTLAGGGIYYSGPTLDLNFVGSLSNPLFSSAGQDYSLNTNFLSLFYQVEAQYSVLGTNGVEQKNFADIVTFTRTGTTATYFNSAGVLTTTVADEPRFDYDPATLLARGFLIEEARTNSIRNNTMVGAVAGTPGTLPTNWAASNLGTLVREVVGTGTVNGITYVDIRLSGTTSTTSAQIFCEPATGGPSASSGQTWSTSNFLAIVGGSLTNITTIRAIQLQGRDGAGAATENFNSGDQKALLTSSMQRFSLTSTLANASTTTLQPGISPTFNSGVAIDITIRIGLPQLELGAFATSVIPTTTTALTRSADVATVNTLSPWFNATESTIYLEFTPVGMKSIAGQGILRIDDNTESNRISFAATSTNAMINTTFVSNSTSGNNTTPATIYAANTTYKIAFAVRLDDVQSFSGGSAGTIDTTALIPSGLSVLRFAANTTDVTGNAWFRRLTYYPRRLSQADGITITA